MCRKYFQKWYDVLTKPKETFKKEKKNANLSEAAKHIGLAGLIAGVIIAIFSSMIFSATFFAAIVFIIIIPVIVLIFWLVSSFILYLLAKLFGGNGDYDTQTYLLFLYQSPLLILMTIFAFLSDVGAVIAFLIIIYSLYLLTISLRETHNYSTGRAFATWLLLYIIAAILIFFIAFILAAWGQNIAMQNLSNFTG